MYIPYLIYSFICPRMFKFSPHLFTAWWLCSFYPSIIFHCLDVPHFTYPFTFWRMSCLLPILGSYEHSCYKHPCAGFWLGPGFRLLCVNAKWHHCWMHGRSMFSFVGNCQTVLQSSYPILHSQQQCTRIPVAPCPSQHSMLSVSWVLSTGM